MKCFGSGVLAGVLLGLGGVGVVMSMGQGEKAQDATKQSLPGIDIKGDDLAAMGADPKAMEAWMNSMKLGKPHEWLKRFEGEWTTSTKIIMPGGPEMPASTGTASIELIMGGRYVVQHSKGTMMGQPMEGMGISGYDNNRKLFVQNWVDNFMTGIMPMRGNLSKDGKTLTMIGEMDEPMTGEMGKAVRSRTTWIDENTFTFSLDEILYGEPFTVVEVTYSRKK